MPKGRKIKDKWSTAELLDVLSMFSANFRTSPLHNMSTDNYHDPRLIDDPFVGYRDVGGRWMPYPPMEDVWRERAERRLREQEERGKR